MTTTTTTEMENLKKAKRAAPQAVFLTKMEQYVVYVVLESKAAEFRAQGEHSKSETLIDLTQKFVPPKKEKK